MNNINLLLASGTTLLTFLQPLVPSVLGTHAATATPIVEIGNGASAPTSLVNAFFGEEAGTVETEDAIAKQMAFVSSRGAYSASLEVVQRHAVAIKAEARAQNVPEDVAIGVAFLENGGSETAKSSAGALGIYQLMPGTARNLGLTVNKKVDDRKDPQKSIGAGVSYLKSNYERFGDWGLATWAYHAGEGNVAKALKLYAKAHDGINLPGVEDSAALKQYVVSHNITVHKLLSDPAVKVLTDKLQDDSAGYPYKVVATAKLFKQSYTLNWSLKSPAIARLFCYSIFCYSLCRQFVKSWHASHPSASIGESHMFPSVSITVSRDISGDPDIPRTTVYKQLCVFGPDLVKLCATNGKCTGASKAAREFWKIHREKLKRAFNAVEQFNCEVVKNTVRESTYPLTVRLWMGFGQKTLWKGHVHFNYDGSYIVAQ
jgi:hypothetical protein